MSEMTKDQLKEYVESIATQVLNKNVSADVAEVVRENVDKALSSPAPDAVAPHLFDDNQRGEKGETPAPEKGAGFACYARAIAGAHNDPEKAALIAESWGRPEIAAAIKKAMGSNVPTAGGFLVPPEFSSEIIELLRATGVVRSLGVSTVPMPNGTINIPRITSGATASYIGENVNIGATELETGQITLTFKKLAALVPVSNDLIRYAAPSADGIVRGDMIRALQAREDLAFIRGDGLSGTPKGLKNWIHGDNKFASGGTTLALVTTDLGDAMEKLMDAEINLSPQQGGTGDLNINAGWIFHPRQWKFLTTIQTGLGTHAFRDEMLRGTLWGYPFRVTTQCENTTVYFGAFAHAVIGESLNMMVDASQEAAYHDGSNVVASFSLDQTVIRVIAEHDFALRYDKAFALITTVTWGA